MDRKSITRADHFDLVVRTFDSHDRDLRGQKGPHDKRTDRKPNGGSKSNPHWPLPPHVDDVPARNSGHAMPLSHCNAKRTIRSPTVPQQWRARATGGHSPHPQSRDVCRAPYAPGKSHAFFRIPAPGAPAPAPAGPSISSRRQFVPSIAATHRSRMQGQGQGPGPVAVRAPRRARSEIESLTRAKAPPPRAVRAVVPAGKEE